MSLGGYGRVRERGGIGRGRDWGGRGRQLWEVERMPGQDGVTRQAIGSPNGLNTSTGTQRKRIERIPWPHNVHDPAEWRTTGPWSGAGIEDRWQEDLLAWMDGQCAQAVRLHQRKRGDASPPGQAGERVTLLHGVDKPAWRLWTTGYQGHRRGRGRGKRYRWPNSRVCCRWWRRRGHRRGRRGGARGQKRCG
jgi:hypothetical protein